MKALTVWVRSLQPDSFLISNFVCRFCRFIAVMVVNTKLLKTLIVVLKLVTRKQCFHHLKKTLNQCNLRNGKLYYGMRLLLHHITTIVILCSFILCSISQGKTGGQCSLFSTSVGHFKRIIAPYFTL